MKKSILFIIIMIASMTLSHAQLGAPKITVRDTFNVIKILYNEMELAPQDWPGKLVIEDPTRINILGNVYVKKSVEKKSSIYCKHKLTSEQLHMTVECNGKKDILNKELFRGEGICAVYVIGNYDIFVVSTKTRSDFESNDSYFQPTVHHQPDTPKQPEVNTNSLFKKSATLPITNRYDGTPGKGCAGFSLTGRSAKALPSPSVNSNKEGKVVVKIWVDRAGNVTQVSAPEKGSTLTDAAYVEQAKTAARKAKFSAKDDAPESQSGTITYVFRNN